MSQAAFFDVLQKAKEDDALVAIYTNPDNSRAFLAGWVEMISNEHVVLRHLSPHGRYDGYTLQYLERIFRVDTNGRYLERLQFLYNARRQEVHAGLLKGANAENSLLVEMLAAAKRNDLLVALEIAADDNEVGAVKQINSDSVVIEVLDLLGTPDSETTVLLDAISEIRCDDERLQSLKLLSNWHQMEPPGW